MKCYAALIFLLASGLLRAAPEYPKMGPDIYDPSADGKTLVATALAEASNEHKNVLLVFGANWCIWCHRLHETFASNAEIARILRQNYKVVMVDVNARKGSARNADVDEKYGHPTKLGLPVLVVLAPSGEKLTTQDSGELEDGKSAHDPTKVIAFLDKWAPAKR